MQITTLPKDDVKKRRNLLYKPGRIQHRKRTAGRQTGRDRQ